MGIEETSKNDIKIVSEPNNKFTTQNHKKTAKAQEKNGGLIDPLGMETSVLSFGMKIDADMFVAITRKR